MRSESVTRHCFLLNQTVADILGDMDFNVANKIVMFEMLCDPILPDFQTSWFFPTCQGGGRESGGQGGAVSVWMDLQSLWEFVLWSRLVSVWVRTCRVLENSSCGVGFALCHCIKVHQDGVMQFYIVFTIASCLSIQKPWSVLCWQICSESLQPEPCEMDTSDCIQNYHKYWHSILHPPISFVLIDSWELSAFQCSHVLFLIDSIHCGTSAR